MPKALKKKFNPSVRKVTTFSKKKIKLGRQLSRQNSTNTNIRTKRITLTEQINVGDDDIEQQPISSGESLPKKLMTLKNLEELAPQLGHYNENLCCDAIMGLRHYLKETPELVIKQLRTIIPGIGALLIREIRQSSTRNQIIHLLDQLCFIHTDIMRSHFQLFSTYVLTGITDIRPGIRSLSFDVLTLIMKRYPDLCARNQQIFNGYLQLLGGQRRPTDNKHKLLDSIHIFIGVFTSQTSDSLWQCKKVKMPFDGLSSTTPVQLLPSPAKVFNFPVLYGTSRDLTESYMYEQLVKMSAKPKDEITVTSFVNLIRENLHFVA